MAFRKRTLRIMSPTARKVARLIGEQESVATRLKNLLPDLQQLDLRSQALEAAKLGLVLSESDAWGLRDALYHGIGDGYFDDNKEWADSMVERVNQYRERRGFAGYGRLERETSALSFDSTGITEV